MKKSNRKHTQKEIDDIVIAEADDLSKWESPIRVKPKRVVAFYLKASAVDKIKKLARRKRVKSYTRWLAEIVNQRIAQEELKVRTSEKRS